jgi:hypothetical protein
VAQGEFAEADLRRTAEENKRSDVTQGELLALSVGLSWFGGDNSVA